MPEDFCEKMDLILPDWKMFWPDFGPIIYCWPMKNKSLPATYWWMLLEGKLLAYYSGHIYQTKVVSFTLLICLCNTLYPKQTNNIRVLYMPLAMLWVSTVSDRGVCTRVWRNCVLGFHKKKQFKKLLDR
jgi:hypothetical protein